MIKYYFLIFICLRTIFPTITFAIDDLSSALKNTNESLIQDYLKEHKVFFKKLCRAGDDNEYNNLHKKFLGDGFYVPTKIDGKLDFDVVRIGVNKIKQKNLWIKNQIKIITKTKNFKDVLIDVGAIKKLVNDLVFLKEKLEIGQDSRMKEYIKSDKLLNELRVRYSKLLEGIPFLTTYQFPINYQQLRSSYEKVKNTKDPAMHTKKNMIYFSRKIYEDGAQNPDHQRNDKWLRGMLSMIFIRLQSATSPISEELRYDLLSAMDKIKNEISRNKNGLILRMSEWQLRTKRSFEFYSNLISEVKKNEFKKINHLLSEKKHSRTLLQQFNLKKQYESYMFWSKKSEFMQALFTLETILYNEVGVLDGQHALERKDVAKVVVNRRYDPTYSFFHREDHLYKYFLQRNNQHMLKQRWLNVLFKEGEFSFTYFFIPGSVRVYCPDMSRRGQRIREQNLQIALETLRAPKSEEKMIRYFSRHSMFGRINMAQLWKGFFPVREKVGAPSDLEHKYKLDYLEKKFNYLYSFFGPEGKRFQVLEFKKFGKRVIKVISHELGKILVYDYRNPHMFRYFREK